jgi:hypothetical protein
MCNDRLSVTCVVDHKQALKVGGSNALSNLQVLCRYCHADKTALEAGEDRVCGLESALNLATYHDFHKGVKGRQQVWGRQDAKGSRDEDDHLCVDITSCRLESVLAQPYLPVFAPTDEKKPYTGGLDDFDFGFADMTPGFLEKPPPPPYDYPRWYHRDALIELKRLGALMPHHIKFTLTASRRVPIAVFKGFVRWLDKLLGTFLTGRSFERMRKELLLSMLGLMGNTNIFCFTRRVSRCSDDLPRADLLAFDSDANVWTAFQRTEYLTTKSYRAINQIACDGELVRLAWLLQACERLKIIPQAVRNDCVYCVASKPAARLSLEANRTHGQFCRPQAGFHPPTNPPNREVRKQTLRPLSDWDTRVDRSGDLGAQKVHLPALVDSGAGSGKSTLLQSWCADLIREHGQDAVALAAYQVATAKRIGGDSLDRVLRRRGRPKYLLIDELSQVPTTHLIKVAVWVELGTVVAAFGDMCQLKAVVEPWRSALPATGVFYSALVHSLVGGRLLELRVNQRFKNDPAFYEFLDAYREAIKAALMRGEQLLPDPEYARFPCTGRPDVIVCVSNFYRRVMNAWLNQEIAHRPDAVFFECPTNCRKLDKAPQKMWICPGLQMIGVRGSAKIANGLSYTVVKIADRIVVKPEAGDVVALTPAEFTKSLRLMHAMTYDQIQGLTIADKVVWLADGHSRFICAQRLYVGYARVTESRNLGVMTEDHQRAVASDVIARGLL